MRVDSVGRVVAELVPRDTKAPWLDKCVEKWRLEYDYPVVIDGVKYIVPAGYITDFASIPRFLWRMFPAANYEASHAAVFHDYVYSHLYMQKSKQWADTAFHAIMLRTGARKWVAWAFFQAVKRFGKGGWAKNVAKDHTRKVNGWRKRPIRR